MIFVPAAVVTIFPETLEKLRSSGKLLNQEGFKRSFAPTAQHVPVNITNCHIRLIRVHPWQKSFAPIRENSWLKIGLRMFPRRAHHPAHFPEEGWRMIGDSSL
ncbi:MAG: hypothetical protein KDH84_06215, partial [Calditrichaeota bacterium]|nr:hypothetical protein [Calditrichota bacterium]